MIGIDIVQIKRIEKAMEKPSFLNKVLTKKEIEYVNSKENVLNACGINQRAATLAGLYAAKESVLKAFKVGITNGYGFKDVEIDHDKFGAPLVIVSVKLEKLLKNLKKEQINVSISHDGEYAIAVCCLDS